MSADPRGTLDQRVVRLEALEKSLCLIDSDIQTEFPHMLDLDPIARKAIGTLHKVTRERLDALYAAQARVRRNS